MPDPAYRFVDGPLVGRRMAPRARPPAVLAVRLTDATVCVYALVPGREYRVTWDSKYDGGAGPDRRAIVNASTLGLYRP